VIAQWIRFSINREDTALFTSKTEAVIVKHMNVTEERYLLKTRNFSSNWLWLERAFALLLVLTSTYYLELQYPGSLGYKSVFIVMLVILILLMPVTDIALDKRKFYYVRRSIFPAFSKNRRYDVSDIKEISFSKKHTQKYDMLKILFSPSWYDARIVLADKRVVSLRMHKQDIDILRASFKSQREGTIDSKDVQS
jgi:hypothetical protein